jgi:Uncharacterized protein conserved in bacteria
MDINVEIGLLSEFYGSLLTEKQASVIEDYYNNDLSLSEIAENNNITRQGVRDNIKQAEKKLYDMEEKLGLMKRFLSEEKKIKSILKNVLIIEKDIEQGNNDILPKIKEIKQQLSKLVKT